MFKKVLMYISSFIPIIGIIIVKDFLSLLNESLEQNSFSKLINYNLYFMLFVWIIIFISFYSFLKNNKSLVKNKVKVIKVKNRTAEYYIQYFSLFILSLISISFLYYIEIIVFILIVAILGIVYIKNDLFYINPTINILKCYIYEIDYEDNGILYTEKLIISKDKILNNSVQEIELSEFEFAFARQNKRKK